MLKRFSEEQLRMAIADLDTERYDYYGLRVCNKKYEVGAMCDKSHQLFQDPQFADEKMTELLYPYIEDGAYAGYYDGGELDGTCAIRFEPEDEDSINNAIELIEGYPGKYLYIIAGDCAMAGNDDGEIIIPDAEVIYRDTKKVS